MNNKLNNIFLKKLGLLKNKKEKNKNDGSLVNLSSVNLPKKEYLNTNYKNLKPLVSLDEISVIFNKKNKNKRVLYKNLNFTIFEDQMIAIIGSNGVGKTTLFEILTRIKKPTSGKVVYHEKLSKEAANKYINMQSQDLLFPTGLLVKDIVNFVVNLQNINLNDIGQEFEEMLNIFKLKDLWFNKASKLSGGQQQRLNLFISLLNHPKILLLDEYVTGLDITSKENIENFLQKFIKKYSITLLFISHDLSGLTQVAERYVVIDNGKIVVDLPRNDVIAHFGSINNLIKNYIN